MKLMELYDEIDNPIDDLSVIEKLIQCYANSSKGTGGYYGKLTKTVQKESIGKYLIPDADKFYSMLFNKWKNNIVSMTRDEFIKLYKQGSYGEDFIKMRNYLKNVSDVSTERESNEVFFGNKEDKELESAINKYRWSALGEASGWVHVCSRNLTAKKDEYPNVEHRLYLDTESLDTYKIVTLFVEKCDKYHVPYYFKFDQYANRDDTIVVYSSTENLTKYIEIFQEIKKENPSLISKFKEPPILTGKIDSWIGYGSEPNKTSDGKNQSFNDIRSKILESSIRKVTKNWIMEHKNDQITYHGKKINFQEYMAIKSTEKLIANLEKRYFSFEENEKAKAKSKGYTYKSDIVLDKLGYTLFDVRSLQFKQNIYEVLKNYMELSLQTVCNKGPKSADAIKMNVRNSKQITFSGYDLETVIEELSIKIAKNDPNFMTTIQKTIKDDAKQYGIDSEKFCFDMKTIEKMRTIDAQKELENIQNEKSNIKEKIIEKTNEFDDNSFNVQNLPLHINPVLMGNKMRLPNGNLISAKQYIQEIVYPYLPENGIVILNNGAVITVKQFIEECVMFECQDKYNGDFPKYMVERTRNNPGVIFIENGEETYNLNPAKITDYINPNLLEQRVHLPNGVEMSAKQYIQEIYSPYIPSNGKVILSNGAIISVKRYIEEVLLSEGQDKYNGDIEQILYNTTMNNTGTINADPPKLQENLTKIRSQSELLNQESISNVVNHKR